MGDPLKDLYDKLVQRNKTKKSFEDWSSTFIGKPANQDKLYGLMKQEKYIESTDLETFKKMYFSDKKKDSTEIPEYSGVPGTDSLESSSPTVAPTAATGFDPEQTESTNPFETTRKAIDVLYDKAKKKANELNPAFQRIEDDRDALDIAYSDLTPDEQERLDMLTFDEKTLRLEGKESPTDVPAPVPGGGNPITKWFNAKLYDYVFRDLTEEKLSDIKRPAWANLNPEDKAWYDKQETVQKSAKRFNFELNVLTQDQKNISAGMEYVTGKLKKNYGDDVFDRYATDVKRIEEISKEVKDKGDEITEKEYEELKKEYDDISNRWVEFQEDDSFIKLGKLEKTYQKNFDRYKALMKDDGYQQVRDLMDVKQNLIRHKDATNKVQQGAAYYLPAVRLNAAKENWVRAMNSMVFSSAGVLIDNVENLIGDEKKDAWDELSNTLISFGEAAKEYVPQTTYDTRPFLTDTKVIKWNDKEYHVDDGEAVRDKDGYLVDVMEATNVLENIDNAEVLKDYKRIGTQGFIGKSGQLFADLGALMMSARLGGSTLAGMGMGETAAMRIGLTAAAAGQVSVPLYEESLKVFGDTEEGRRLSGAFTLTTSAAIGAVNLLFGGEMLGAGKGFLDDVIKGGAITPLLTKMATGKTAELSMPEVAKVVTLAYLRHGAQEMAEEDIELLVESASKNIAEYVTGVKFGEVLNMQNVAENSIMGFTGGILMAGGNLSAEVNRLQKEGWYRAANSPAEFKKMLLTLQGNGFNIDNKMKDDLGRIADSLAKKKAFLGNKFGKHFDLIFEHEMAMYQAAQAKEAGMARIAKQWDEKAAELEEKLSKILNGFEAEPQQQAQQQSPSPASQQSPSPAQQAQQQSPSPAPTVEIDPVTGKVTKLAPPEQTTAEPVRTNERPALPGYNDAPVAPSPSPQVVSTNTNVNKLGTETVEGSPNTVTPQSVANPNEGNNLPEEGVPANPPNTGVVTTEQVTPAEPTRTAPPNVAVTRVTQDNPLPTRPVNKSEGPEAKVVDNERYNGTPLEGTPRDVPQGTYVNYQGVQGFLIQNEDGTTEVQTLDGQRVQVEGASSGRSNEEIGLREAPNVQLSQEEMVKVEQDPNYAVDTDQVVFEGDTNSILIHGNRYTYDGVETDADGNTTAIRVIDESGKTKYIRSQDAIVELEIQKELYEQGNSFTARDIDQAASDLGIQPTTKSEPGGTGTPSNVQSNGSATNTQSNQSQESSLASTGEGGTPNTAPSPSPQSNTQTQQEPTTKKNEGTDGTTNQPSQQSPAEPTKKPDTKQDKEETDELTQLYTDFIDGKISAEKAIEVLEKNGIDVPFGLELAAFMEDKGAMNDPVAKDIMAETLRRFGGSLVSDVKAGFISPEAVLKAYNELGVDPPVEIAKMVGQDIKPAKVEPTLSKEDKKALKEMDKLREKYKEEIDSVEEQKKTELESRIEQLNEAIAEIEAKMTEEQLKNRYNMNAGIPINGELFRLHVLRGVHYIKLGYNNLASFLQRTGQKLNAWWAKVWGTSKQVYLNHAKYNHDYSGWDKLIRLLQDSDRFVLRLKKNFERAGIPLPGSMDFYTKKQLQRSKADYEMQLVREEILGKNKDELGYKKSRKESLIGRMMDETGYTIDQFNEFLYALHAGEFNERVRAIQNERQREVITTLMKKIRKAEKEKAKGLSNKQKSIQNWYNGIQAALNTPPLVKPSGMTDAEATAILDQARAAGKFDALERYAQEFKQKVTDRIPTELYRGSLIDEDTRDILLDGESSTGVKFNYYVPFLITEEAYDAARDLDYRALDEDVTPEVVKQIVGTDEFTVDDRQPPLFAAMGKLHQAITNAEDNLTKLALHDMIEDDINNARAGNIPGRTKGIHRYEVVRTIRVPSLNKMGQVVFFDEMIHPASKAMIEDVEKLGDIKENGIPVRKNGETRYIWFAPVQNEKTGKYKVHPIVETFAKNPRVLNDTITTAMKWMRGAVGLFRLMVTTWYPDFAVANFVRDFQDAIVMVNRFQEDKNGMKLMKDIALAVPNAAKVMFKAPWLSPNDPEARDLMEAYRAGMKVSWSNYQGVSQEIEKMNQFRYDGPLKVGLKWFGNRLAYLSDSTEGIMRLATYNAMRKNGVDVQEAAAIAKNITINFETKGTAGPYLNSAFLFLNAGIQGAANSIRLLKSKRGQQFLLASVGFGMLNRALSNFLAGDDKEWRVYKNNEIISTYNTLIYNPIDNSVLTVPKPYSIFRVSTWFGESAVDLFTGDKNKTDIQIEGMMQALAVFDPYGGGIEEPSKFFVPTLALPVIQLQNNKTWYGTKAYTFDWTNQYSDYLQYNAATIGKGFGFEDTKMFYPYTEMAEDLKENIGLDMSPSTMEYLWGRYFTGSPKFFENILKTGVNMSNGEFSFKEAPILRRFYTRLQDNDRLAVYNLYQILDDNSSTVYTDRQVSNAVKYLKHVKQMALLPDDEYRSLFKEVAMKVGFTEDQRDFLKKFKNMKRDMEYIMKKEDLERAQEEAKQRNQDKPYDVYK